MHAMYRIKVMLGNWQTLFWTVAFPVFLSLVFYFMFGGITELEMFQELPIAVVMANETGDQEFTKIASEIEIRDGKKMFSVTEYNSLEEAYSELKDEKVIAIIDLNRDYEITVKSSSMQGTLVKSFVNQYVGNRTMILDAVEKHPERVPALVAGLQGKLQEEIRLQGVDLKGQDKDPYSQYFFAVIAMTCLMACNMGVSITEYIQANQTSIGARRCASAKGKGRQLLEDFLATYLIYDIMTFVVLLFLIFVLKRDFGSNLPLVALATFIGNFSGMAVGLFFGVLQKKPSKMNGACVGFFMGSSFFAGLQWANITYILEQKAPIINRINPATLIVNSFKSLAVFGDTGKYLTNVSTLFAIGVLFMALSIVKFRRDKYASI